VTPGPPTVHVLTPTKDRPDRLRGALASLQAQTHGAWRAWVVDDGDGAGVAAVRVGDDARAHAERNPGRGQVDARNAALDAALAHADRDRDVVMLLDDDDRLRDAGHLAAVVARLADGPALVHRGGWFAFEADARHEPFDPPTSVASLRHDNTVLTVGLAWPAALHADLGRFDPAMGSYFDWDWILRVTDAGVPLAHLEGLGVEYRVHDANTSGRPSEVRTAAFERFVAKHALDVVQKDHVAVHRERRGEG
jgi:glycosyltransferase involved in cell wall biosynthesis